MPTYLESLSLPNNFSAALADDVAQLIAGHSADRELVDFLAAALFHASWTFPGSMTFGELEAKLRALPADSGYGLVELLALPTTYIAQGLSMGLSSEIIARAQTEAKTLRRRLEGREHDATRTLARSLAILSDFLDETPAAQNALASDLSFIITMRQHEMSRQSSHGSRLATLHKSQGARYDAVNSSGRRPGTAVAERPAVVVVPHGQGQMPRSLVDMLQTMMANAQAGSGSSRGEPEQKDVVTVDPTKPALQIFNPAEAAKAQQRTSAGAEGNASQRKLLDSMSQEDGWRQLTEVDSLEVLDPLYASFPHFKPVLDFIKSSLALAACGEDGRPARISPILLRGEPGTGKTYFAQELARVLGTHFVERDLSVTSEAFVISGMDSGWKNSKPGVVFDALVHGKTANPVVCLNEVDKARTTGFNSSPLAAMYALLEPTSAERFTDEFVPVTLNASGIIWVLTANNGEIPEPILSRLEVFDIKTPTKEECRAIGQSVWKSIVTKTLPRGHKFPAELSEELLDSVSNLSPRVMRKALTFAASQAALAGRQQVLGEDLSQGGKRYEAKSTSRGIGFTTAQSQ